MSRERRPDYRIAATAKQWDADLDTFSTRPCRRP